jgi:hypothetical protein
MKYVKNGTDSILKKPSCGTPRVNNIVMIPPIRKHNDQTKSETRAFSNNTNPTSIKTRKDMIAIVGPIR